MANLKALIVVLTIAAVMFRFARPIALRFSSAEDFDRRRKIWFVLTAVAFLSPSFWLFALVAAPLLVWGGRRDSNPVALYLMLLVVTPSIPVSIPKLIDVDTFKLLTFCVLIPALRRLRPTPEWAQLRRLQTMDWLLVAYGVMQFLIYVRPDLPHHVILEDSPTAAIRRGSLFVLDIFVIYFAVSRCCTSKHSVMEATAAFWLSCLLLAPMALLENTRHWLLYAEMAGHWSQSMSRSPAYLFRGGTLRAQVSAGHALTLGYLLSVGFGFWLHLQQHVKSAWRRLTVVVVMVLGLLASYSRGPWMSAVVMYFSYAALGPRAVSNLFKAVGAAVLTVGVILASPLGEKVTRVLPFMGGSVDVGSIVYRQRLAERSWQLIQEHPFFGDAFVYSKMDDLRQGEGIIDLVNTYAQVTLFYGFVGLFLFLSTFLIGAFKMSRLARQYAQTDPDLARLAASLAACALGTLVMITTASLGLGTEKMYYILAGLASACARVGQLTSRQVAVVSTGEPQPQRDVEMHCTTIEPNPSAKGDILPVSSVCVSIQSG